MANAIKLEDEGREKEFVLKDRKGVTGDTFDIYGMVSRVHSKNTSMSRDYVLADYTSDIHKGSMGKFVIEQRKTLQVINSFLVLSKDKLKLYYNSPEKVGFAYNSILETYKRIERLLLSECDEMAIISRAGKGDVKKGMIMAGRNKEEREELEGEMRGIDTKSKLMEKEK